MNIEEVKIELTNYCKRGCVHCSSNANMENIISLNIGKVKELVDECSNLSVKSIVLTGGEATEYREIEKIISYIKQKGISKIKLYTMCEPTKEKLELIHKLKDLGLTDIIYSLTISLTTDKAVNFDNVQGFLATISNFMDVSFHYCLTTKTVKDFDRLENIFEQLNPEHFKKISFLRYVEHGRGTDALTLSSKELKALKPKIIRLIEKYPNKIHLGSPFNILNITHIPCSAGSKTMIVGYDGSVYPCDAMKYFNYMGSGGNIYEKKLAEIYDSNYFQEIREASNNMGDSCQNCGNANCKGGCMGQKMLDMMKRDSNSITALWYQENALRTMNDFGSKELLKLNAYTGIIGEYGEFFDYIKKLYTHNLTEEKKNEIINLAPNELGDLVWYLSTSLALYYGYTLDEVYHYITRNHLKVYAIDQNLIEQASKKKDPLCPFYENKSYHIDFINQYIEPFSESDNIFDILMGFKRTLNQLDTIEKKEEAIEVVAEVLLKITAISKFLFHKNLSEILEKNIDKLRKRYPEGFDSDVANIRIDANKKYKEEESHKVIRLVIE